MEDGRRVGGTFEDGLDVGEGFGDGALDRGGEEKRECKGFCTDGEEEGAFGHAVVEIVAQA